MKSDSRVTTLETAIRKLYAADTPTKDTWSDWILTNHVFVVADYATELANQYGANADLARAAAMLHDIADTITARKDPQHAQKSLEIARKLLTENGYSEQEIALVVDDALRFHSCHGNERPQSQEGRILATADALAHLKTDFYLFATREIDKSKSLKDIKEWTLEKIDRDYRVKIFFDEVRDQARPDYELIKSLFSR